MFEKDLFISYLLDFYGEILSPKRKTALNLYYNEDFSLAEIADELGITRQGARDLIKNAETDLRFFEEKLGLAQKFKDAHRIASSILDSVDAANLSPTLKEQIHELTDIVSG